MEVKKVNSKNKFDLNGHVFEGYSNDELESLINPQHLNAGCAPWAFWTSELYSFGRLYREWGYYPRCLPLFVYSDHGVHKVAGFAPHEINNYTNVHFTFNEERIFKNEEKSNKSVVLIPHPWVTYRKRRNIKRLNNAKGTLVFVSHTCGGIEISDEDEEDYFRMLDILPEKYKPLILCMHMHDIQKGYHKKLRKYGLPIVTAGNTSSVEFVDSFYNLVKNFQFATSNMGGSQLYYCVEMGIPYFLYGERPKISNINNPNVPLGDMGIREENQKRLVEKEIDLFSVPIDSVSPNQKMFVESMLGLHSNVTKITMSWILWREFFRNFRHWDIVIKPVLKGIKKHGPLKFIKKLGKHIKNT